MLFFSFTQNKGFNPLMPGADQTPMEIGHRTSHVHVSLFLWDGCLFIWVLMYYITPYPQTSTECSPPLGNEQWVLYRPCILVCSFVVALFLFGVSIFDLRPKEDLSEERISSFLNIEPDIVKCCSHNECFLWFKQRIIFSFHVVVSIRLLVHRGWI